jgi:hypothetical protein
MQPAGLQAPGQAAAVDTSGSELRGGHDAVLAGRDLGHQAIGRGAFLPHTVKKAHHTLISPLRPRQGDAH